MNTLQLPEQLRGSWDHALIMTYGLDVPFFERTLLPQFATGCRNKIILADGQHYLDASARYAQKEAQIHHLNQSYVAAGIFGPRDAHAKVILLLNKEQGRLCIGSGNLNQQGYASGGELFTCYEYSTDSFEMLSAFLTMRELIDGLIRHNYLQGPVKRYIDYMWEDTPWLLRTPTGNSRPVRHNLTQSFLTQIEQAVNGEAVEELSILVPFFDKEAIALARLIDTLRPRHTTLLLQPGNTSVDPTALQRVLSDALTLAGFFYSAQLATTKRWQKQLFSLRDSWRQFLCLSPFSLVPEVLSDTQKLLAPLFPYNPPTPAAIVDQLTSLACFDTRASFLNQLEAPGRFPSGSCSFKKETLKVESLGGEATIDCLVIQSPIALASKEAAVALLQAWMQAETLDYYRIAVTRQDAPTTITHIVYYDVAIKKGKYWDKALGNGGAQQISGAIPLLKREWDATLAQLRALAIQIESTFSATSR